MVFHGDMRANGARLQLFQVILALEDDVFFSAGDKVREKNATGLARFKVIPL
jgi:hypothetical protein